MVPFSMGPASGLDPSNDRAGCFQKGIFALFTRTWYGLGREMEGRTGFIEVVKKAVQAGDKHAKAGGTGLTLAPGQHGINGRQTVCHSCLFIICDLLKKTPGQFFCPGATNQLTKTTT